MRGVGGFSIPSPRLGKSNPAAVQAFFALDAELHVCLWSEGMELLLGASAAQALGQPCYQVVKARAPACPGPGCPLLRRLEEGHLKGGCQLALGSAPGASVFEAEGLALPPGLGPRALVFLNPAGKVAQAPLPALVQDVTALGHLATALAPADLGSALQGALGIAREATGAEVAEAFLWDPLSQQMVLAGHQGLFPQAFYQITQFRLGEGYPGLVAALGKPISTQDLPRDERYLRTHVKEKGFRHYLCVPVRGTSGVLGCLNIASRQSEADFVARLPLLSSFAIPLGTAIQAWRFQAPEGLEYLGPRPGITLEDNLRRQLGGILHNLMEAGQAHVGGAVVYDPASKLPLLQVAEGEESGEAGPAEACLALQERRPIPTTSCTGLACGSRPRGARLCLPLLSELGALGMAWLAPQDGALAYGVRFILLSAIAQKAAGLLGHALTYRQLQGAALQAEKERLDQALKRAATPAAAGGPPLYIQCLGPFQMFRNDQPLPTTVFPRRRALAALKLLAAHRGRPVPAEVLMEHLWPDADPARARNRLHGVINALRRGVEPSPGPPWCLIHSQGDGYCLDAKACWVDVDGFLADFRQGLEHQRQGQPEAALRAYRSAAQLYRGDFLEDEPYEEWCWGEREHLRETYLELLRRMAWLLGSQGEGEESLRCLRQALRVDPLREELHRELMASLARAGRRDQALRQYQECRRLLRQELGVGPLPQTERLYREILNRPSP